MDLVTRSPKKALFHNDEVKSDKQGPLPVALFLVQRA
jgi:hypothetical protein